MNRSNPNPGHTRACARRERRALPAAALAFAMTLAAIPAFAVRPETTGNLVPGKSDPFRTGLRHLRPLRTGDLLDPGEAAVRNRVPLSGDAGAQIVRRLNARLRAAGTEARIRSTQPDGKGNLHIRVDLFHRGYPVIGGDAVIHVNADNEAYAVGGSLAEGLSPAATAKLSAADAAASARKASGRPGSAVEKQAPRLVVFDGALAYETLVEEKGTAPHLWKAFIDANTGELLFREDRIVHAAPVGGAARNVTGSILAGEGGGTATINGWLDNLNLYFLRNNTALWGVYDMDRSDWSQNTTGDWGTTDRAAVSLAKNFELTQRYVTQVLGRNSFDNAGAFATANAHEGTNYVNAYWDGSSFHFGDGDGVEAAPLTTLDVAAHEYGHAITQYTSNLIYSNESGALNESYSDIMGAAVEFWAQPDGRAAYPAGQDGRADWLMGEDCWLSSDALRDLRNPGRYGQPSYYGGTNWYPGADVHTNSGVQNFAFYLLSEGGTGSNDGHPYAIAGLGYQAASAIAWYANMYLLTSASQYRDAREAWILAASTLGYNAQTVRDVWTACGVLEQVNNLAVSPASLAFGPSGVGATAVLNLTLSNNGAIATTVTGLAFDNAAFSSAATLPITVAGGASLTVPVRFRPAALGAVTAALTIASNADDNPSLRVPLSGTGVAPAAISITPGSFAVSLPTGGSATRTLTIANTGAGDALDWTLQGVSRTPALQASDASTIDILSWVPYTDMTGEYANVVAAINAYANPHTFATSVTFDPAVLETSLADKDLFMMPERENGSIPAGTGAAFRTVLQAFLDRGGEIMVHLPGSSDAWNFLSEVGLMQITSSNYAYSGEPCVTVDPSHPLMAGVTGPLTMLNATAGVTVTDNTTVLATYNNYMVVGVRQVGRGRVIVLGPDFYEYTPNWAHVISNAVNLAPTAASNWLTASALSGSVPAGESQTVTLSFDAASLAGGTYTADLLLGHDDPATANPLHVPATLEVDGFRRLSASPSSLAFGNLWAGTQRTQRVTLTNAGSEATVISAIATGHPEFTTSVSLPLTLQPFQSAPVDVRFAPADIGPETATLSITSNAEDNPSLAVALSGAGTSAPGLMLSPGSISATVNAGETATPILTVSNAGGADLEFSIVGADGRILINEFSNEPDFIELWNQGADRAIGGWRLSWVDNAGSSVLSFTFPAGYVLRSGRRVVVRENTGTANDSTFYAGANIGWVEGSVVAITLADGTGRGVDFVRTTGSTEVPPAGTSWTTGGVGFTGYSAFRNRNDDTDGPDGWGFSGTPSEFLLNPGQSAGGSFPSWLTVSPTSGTVAFGMATPVLMTLNSAGLLGGAYPATVLVKSNDPMAPAAGTPVPVTFTVVGQKRLTAPTALAFGNAWAGTRLTRSLVLQNPGNEATTVSSLVSSLPEFSSSATLPLTVPAFGSLSVDVAFAPVDAGAESGTLTLTSDAGDNPSLTVALTGTGTLPPVAAIVPNAFSILLAPGQAPADRTATLSNSGGDNLNWRIASIEQTGSPVPPSSFAPAANPPPVRADLIYAESNYAHPYLPGRVIVGFKPGRETFASSQAAASLGIKEMRELAKAIDPKTGRKANTGRKVILLEIQAAGGVRQAIDLLRQDANVAYAEPDFVENAVAIPNDASFGQLYGMHNIGQNGGTADADIDAPEAWDRHTGNRSILIGVIDTGIDYLHPDLAANIWTNPGEIAGNGIDDDHNGFIDDVHGWDFAYDDNNPTDGHYHGTHVSGTIAGIGNNGVGVAGVMWNASLVALKFLNDGGSGSLSDAVDAVNYANAMGIRITSNSWGGGGFSQALMDAIAAGGLFIAAAGNDGVDNDVSPHYPSSYALGNVIAVAATDNRDALASFSCYGLTSVDLGAPGVNTYSTAPGNSYQTLSGTSMATPHVSGVAGLVWTANPGMSAAQVKAAILASTDPDPALAGRTVTGGRLNARKALEAAGPNWLRAAPSTPGVLAPGASAPITLTVDPAGMAAGRWTGLVTLATDDPAHATLPISVTADITGCRSLTVDPVAYDFGARYVGSATRTDLTLRNACNDTVQVASVASSLPAFSLAAALPIKIPPFQAITVAAEFRPTAAGPVSGTLELASDADTDPVKSVALRGEGVLPPLATANPSSVSRTLSPGAAAVVDLDIGNTGGSDLLWSLSGVSRGFTAQAPYASSHFATLGKGEPDDRVGRPVTEASGGPDAFGYRWTDSDQPGGPVYLWQDISATGTLVLSGCDDCSGSRPLSFGFPFYGNRFSQVYFTTNGWVSFTNSTAQYSNYPLPSASMPANLVAAFFDDLSTSGGGGVYFQDFGDRAVVQYQNVPYYSGSGTVTFQIVLRANGEIDFYYENMTGSVLSATTGIQDGTAAVGLQVQYNTAYIRNRLAVRINTVPDWIRVSELSGTVPAGGTQRLALTLDARSLTPGNYAQTLTLSSNNPFQAPIAIPVNLTVTGVAGVSRVLRVGPSALAAAAGSRYYLWNVTVGGETRGMARGSRYTLYLK